MAKRLSNEEIIAAIISAGTIKGAAARTGYTERAIYDRMKTPDFKKLYQEAKTELLRETCTALQYYSITAVETLADVMQNKDAAAQSRVNAATAILQHANKYTEALDVLERLEAVEAAQAAQSAAE